jgi:UDP-glucose 4-epimerase
VGRRVLITGLDTFWGGRMAQALEAESDVEMILGLGTKEPRVPLERTEFVRSDQKYSILSRIVRATQVDTIVHTFLETNSIAVPSRVLHEINVIGTLNLLAAAGASGTSVRKVIIKSSTHVYGAAAQDPAWFREEDTRSGPVRTKLERSLLEVESLVRDFADDNPHLTVTLLRFANVLGTDIITPISHNLRRRLLPCVAGFDPLVQFVEEDDVVRALEFVTSHRVPGVFNVAGEGKLPWTEVASIVGAHLVPLPPIRGRAIPAGDGRAGHIRSRRRHFPPAPRRIRVPLHQCRNGAQLRPSQQPATLHRVDCRRIPLRAGRGAVLPALPCSGPRHRHLILCTTSVRSGQGPTPSPDLDSHR